MPINNTNIPCPLVAIWRDFKFPLDIELGGLPTLNDTSNNNLIKYLHNVSNQSQFASSVLKILVEERGIYHCLHHNDTIKVAHFQVGDVVKLHVQAHSNTDKHIVGKLSYQVKRTVSVVQVRPVKSYLVQHYNILDGPVCICKKIEL